jgi:hypothetical protein
LGEEEAEELEDAEVWAEEETTATAEELALDSPTNAPEFEDEKEGKAQEDSANTLKIEKNMFRFIFKILS